MPNGIVEHRTHPPLTGRSLKVSIVHQPTELLTQPVPEAQQRVTLRIKRPRQTVTAEIAAKSPRRAQTTINEVGAEAVAVILQAS